MKPRNPIYLGDRTLDPPEDVVMINCTYCRKSSYSAAWIKNRGHCPLCHKAYTEPEIEEDL